MINHKVSIIDRTCVSLDDAALMMQIDYSALYRHFYANSRRD
jgi:hypothetical protein